MAVPPLGGMEEQMFIAQASPENVQSLEPVIIIIAIALVLFWRAALKILAVIMVALIVSGIVMLIQNMHQAVR